MTKPTPEQEFAKSVLSMEPIRDFKPAVTYIPEGDCLECVFSAEDYRAERIDGRITIYRGRETGQVVGAVIKGFRRLLTHITKNCVGFTTVVHSKSAKLEYLLLAHVFCQARVTATPIRKTYRQLLDKAEEAAIQVPLAEFERLAAK